MNRRVKTLMTVEQFNALHWESRGNYLVLPDSVVIDKNDATPEQMLTAALRDTAAVLGRAEASYKAGGPGGLQYDEELWRLHIETLKLARWAIERLTAPATDMARLTFGVYDDEENNWLV